MWKNLAVIIALAFICSAAQGDEESADTLSALKAGVVLKQALIDGRTDETCTENGVGDMLAAMIDLDQFVRRSLHMLCPTRDEKCIGDVIPVMETVDASNLGRLKRLLTRYSWTDLARCAPHAQHNAWLLVQHADAEPKFQIAVLADMKAAFLAGTTDGEDYAYLADRVAVNSHKPQIYGTQGACQPDGSWKPDTIAAPHGLDERRREMNMATTPEYLSSVSQLCARPKPKD